GHFAQDKVDYNSIIPFKQRLLETAWTNFNKGSRKDLRDPYEEFRAKQVHWLEDYALFRALKAKYRSVSYLEWSAELVQRSPQAMENARTELAGEIDQIRFSQFLLFRQADQLKDYAHGRGVGLIGDLPFFVSPDSSDVWTNPEFFLLDEQRQPRFVAGVPPDYFSAQGQLWGNPVYNWGALRSSGYRWCIDRLRALLAHVDVIRLDHFRGFAAAWHVPAGAKTAQTGEWVPGPGADFFQAVQRELGGLPFIAEDLGLITPDVRALRDEFKVAGTRVLQFAFDGHADNPHLPENFVSNTVVYTGTHDNATTREWYEECTDSQRKQLWSYLERAPDESSEVAHAMMGLAFDSVAALAIAPLQDLLNLGKEARMNVPGSIEGNWRWRCSEKMLAPAAFEWLKELTDRSKRPAWVVQE
ncbi:MAG: 4-alpha-glucanotransferase, partial [Acidobacteriota bacterium]|nr:4-alpha-glucanotransferase [Acidobacteriota bacterium]